MLIVLHNNVHFPPFFPQLRAFGLSVVMENGQMRLFPPKPSNIYLPYLKLLNQDTLQMSDYEQTYLE